MGQLELLEKSRRSAPGDVSDEVIERLPNMLAAIKLCVQVSGFEDKPVCGHLEIDAAQWSRIKAGTANFPTNKLNDLMDYCGNEIPLRWQAMSRGYELKRRLSEIEAELERQRAENAELRNEISIVRKWFADK